MLSTPASFAVLIPRRSTQSGAVHVGCTPTCKRAIGPSTRPHVPIPVNRNEIFDWHPSEALLLLLGFGNRIAARRPRPPPHHRRMTFAVPTKEETHGRM